jgi:predicted DNA-binding transcriptional regulator YafY
MKKTSGTEAIRRGFNILATVSRSPMSSRDIFNRLADAGFNVSIRTIERDLSRLPDIFPSMIEVDERSKPFTYRQPLNAKKYSAMNPTEAICLELAFSFLNPIKIGSTKY